MNAPRLVFPDLPHLVWREGRCTNKTAEICAVMSWLRKSEFANTASRQLYARLWNELTKRFWNVEREAQ